MTRIALLLIASAVALLGAAGERRPRPAVAQSEASERRASRAAAQSEGSERRASRAAAQSEGSERRRVIAPPGVKPVGPYSPGILAGDFLYVSGQGGRDAGGTLPGTVEGQARQTLQNVKAIVEAAGLTLEHVVYSQVYLEDMARYEAIDRVWREFFPKAPPARAVLGVYKLPADVAVEINAVAFRDLSRKRPVVPAGSSQNRSWSAGMMAGNRLYLSGFMGTDAASGRLKQDPDAQVQLALDNMKQTLAAAGLDFRHVVF
ncbi:MAG TPA: RidA family protein, partial [Gemmataceae bacterium]|nr:RidA family protein [Gemmataceae bacterium]